MFHVFMHGSLSFAFCRSFIIMHHYNWPLRHRILLVPYVRVWHELLLKWKRYSQMRGGGRNYTYHGMMMLSLKIYSAHNIIQFRYDSVFFIFYFSLSSLDCVSFFLFCVCVFCACFALFYRFPLFYLLCECALCTIQYSNKCNSKFILFSTIFEHIPHSPINYL